MPTRLRLEWREAARKDLLAIIDYISGFSSQAAVELLDEIEAKVSALPVHPEKYARSQRAKGYRQLTVRENYLIFYRLVPEDHPQLIEVAAVVHARRKWP